MTIETLIHIYNLLQADVGKKKFAYDIERNKKESWEENTGRRNQYPDQERYEMARDEYYASSNAMDEFKAKEWN